MLALLRGWLRVRRTNDPQSPTQSLRYGSLLPTSGLLEGKHMAAKGRAFRVGDGEVMDTGTHVDDHTLLLVLRARLAHGWCLVTSRVRLFVLAGGWVVGGDRTTKSPPNGVSH